VLWSDRFVWLHVPKCAGTQTRAVLRKLGAFDEDLDPNIWHQGRREGLTDSGRVVVANFRRLPSWVLSLAHYEAARGGGPADPWRWSGDDVLARYDADRWIRAEHLPEDFAAAFGDLIELPTARLTKMFRKRRNATDYDRSLEAWFTPADLEGLYAANPAWAALERRLYGDLLV